MSLSQYAFRFYNDDGGEATSTPYAAENTNITWPLDTNIRLRIGITHDGSAAPATSPYILFAARQGTGQWFEVASGGSGRIRLSKSAGSPNNIPDGGQNTSNRLSKPGVSPTPTFTPGRIWDDESGQDAVAIASGQFTELEFCLAANSALVSNGQIFDFKVLRASSFLPSSLSGLLLWLEAEDLSTMFQSNAGVTAVAADGDVVGYWGDQSSNAFNLTSTANDTTRPTYHTAAGLSWVDFDGTNDILQRAADIGMYSAGACSVFLAVRGNPGVDARLVASGSSSSNTPIYSIVQAHQATASSGSAFLRNDIGGLIIDSGGSNLLVPSAFNNADRVYGVTDDGSTLRAYLDGVADDTYAYVRANTVTMDLFSLGGLMRAAASSFFAGRVYAICVVNRVLTTTERANLTTYLGTKAGLTV